MLVPSLPVALDVSRDFLKHLESMVGIAVVDGRDRQDKITSSFTLAPKKSR